MKGEIIVMVFLGIGFLFMGIMYYLERLRFENMRKEKNHWRKKYMNGKSFESESLSNNIPNIMESMKGGERCT